MAKHGLNTNAASIAIGVSVPTLRKALRGHNVSRKTTAKIESIIASGKVPEAAKTTVKRTPKKTAAAKPAAKTPAAKTRTRQTTAKAPATKPSTTKQAATKTPTRQAKAQTQPTSIAATDQNKAAVHSQENSASPQSPRRTTKRVARTTTTGRQANRNTRQPVVLTLRVSQSRPPNGRQRAIIVSPFASSLMSQPSKHKARPTNVRRRQQTVSLLLIQ